MCLASFSSTADSASTHVRVVESTILYGNPGNSPNSRWPCRDASALDGIVVVVFINSKGKINIFCLKVLNLKGKTQFLSNYFLRVAKVPAKINDAKGNPSLGSRFQGFI